MRGVALVGACSVAVALVFAVGSARAQTCADRPQPTAADKETARSLMADGRLQLEQSDPAGALEKFKAADAIMKVPTTGLEVARTYAALGKLVEARDTLAAVARIPECPGDPVPFMEARAQARKLDQELAPRVPAIRLNVKGAQPGTPIIVKVDDVPVPEAALSAPRRVNPGRHLVVAKSGMLEATQQVDVAEREVRDVDLELAPSGGNGHGDGAVRGQGPVVVKTKGPILSKPVAYVALGVGGLGLVVGTITGLMASSAKSDAEKGCVNNKCPPPTYADLDRAQSMATVSTVGFVVGIAGVGVGVVGLLTQPKADAPKDNEKVEPKTTKISPWIGVGSAGVSGTF